MDKISLSRIQKITLMVSVIAMFFMGIPVFNSPVKTVYATTSTIDTQFPTRATPNAEQNITDLSYWIDTLPDTASYNEDKTARGYVVYPKQ